MEEKITQEALNIMMQDGTTKENLKEVLNGVLENVSARAVSEQIKAKNGSGNPEGGVIEYKRFVNAELQDKGTARKAGEGNKVKAKPVKVYINDDKEIVGATENTTYTAIWEATVSYNVTFDANGGKSDASCLSIYYNSTYDELANASREGYKFLGWYTEKEGGTLIKNDTVYNLTTNQTLYAHWEKINVKGDVNADGKFNISDVVILQKWLLAVPNTKLADWKAADLCEDDRLDVFDLCMMKRMLIANS